MALQKIGYDGTLMFELGRPAAEPRAGARSGRSARGSASSAWPRSNASHELTTRP